MLSAALLTLLFAEPSLAAPQGTWEISAAQSPTPPKSSVTVIGDSVTLGAKLFASMRARIAKAGGVSWCRVDAKGSRRLEAGIKLAKELKGKGRLGDIVVYSLTTNGHFGYDEAKAAIKAVGKGRPVVFVTGYVKGHSYFKRSNAAVRKLASENGRVFVADWNKFISGKKDKQLSDDYCHLNATSGRWYVDVVKKAVGAARKSSVEQHRKGLLGKARLSAVGSVALAAGTANPMPAPAAYWGAYTKGKNPVWDSSDPSVVGVDQGGYMRAVGTGTAIVTASGGGASAQIRVDVKPDPAAAASLGVSVEKVNRWALRILAAPSPADAVGVPQFSSSDPKTVKVNRAGVAVGKKKGRAKVTVRFGSLSSELYIRVR